MIAARIVSILGLGLAVTLSSAFATTYTYSTSGCFSGASVTNPSTSASATCSAAGSTFSFKDLGGTETIGYTDAVGLTVMSGNNINLGTFSFSSTGSGSGAVYFGNFSLAVNFTTPTGVTGGPFNAIMSGNQYGAVGGSTISFNPQTEAFTSSTGNFTITLLQNPVQVNSSSQPTFTLLGSFGSGATVPEPVPVGLLGAGLAGIGLLRWRHKTQRG